MAVVPLLRHTYLAFVIIGIIHANLPRVIFTFHSCSTPQSPVRSNRRPWLTLCECAVLGFASFCLKNTPDPNRSGVLKTHSTGGSIPTPEPGRRTQALYKRSFRKTAFSPLSSPLSQVAAMASYGQHAPSSSFQQDSALVARFASQDQAERDRRALAPSDLPEEFFAWNDTPSDGLRPNKPTLGRPMYQEDILSLTNERAPLLRKPSVSRINETYESSDDHSDHDHDYRRAFFDEVKTLARYTLPIFG